METGSRPPPSSQPSSSSLQYHVHRRFEWRRRRRLDVSRACCLRERTHEIRGPKETSSSALCCSGLSFKRMFSHAGFAGRAKCVTVGQINSLPQHPSGKGPLWGPPLRPTPSNNTPPLQPARSDTTLFLQPSGLGHRPFSFHGARRWLHPGLPRIGRKRFGRKPDCTGARS